MLPNFLIVLGALFIILGVIGLLHFSIPQLRKAIQDEFLHNTDDSSYDYDKVPASRKLLKKSCSILIIVGVVLLSLGLWIKFAPRGNNLFQSDNIDGISTGNDNVEYQQDQEHSTTGNYVSSNGESYSYYVIVSEKTIFINEDEIGGTEEFEEYLNLEKIDRVHTGLLVDDYAVSSTYHKVEELLDAYGMRYETESD